MTRGDGGDLVFPRNGGRRNALLWLLGFVILAGVTQARAGAQGHLGAGRALPCAHSPAADADGENQFPHHLMSKKTDNEPVTNVQQWLQLFNSSTLYKHEPSRMLDDYLTLTLCTLANQKQEARYLEVARRYSREELEVVAKLFAYHMLIHEHQVAQHGWYDMLGDVYMELAGRSRTSRMGQFFTPVAVCDLTARITVGDQPEDLVGKSILEPAAGSGRMVLALHALQPRHGIVAAADLDPTCAKMCALNFWLHGITGEVAWMDSLSLKWYGAWQTWHTRFQPFVVWIDDPANSILGRQTMKHQDDAQPTDLFNQPSSEELWP